MNYAESPNKKGKEASSDKPEFQKKEKRNDFFLVQFHCKAYCILCRRLGKRRKGASYPNSSMVESLLGFMRVLLLRPSEENEEFVYLESEYRSCICKHGEEASSVETERLLAGMQSGSKY